MNKLSTDVIIPPRMKHLPLDRRGYPVPENVYVDNDGRPHFTINLEGKRIRSLMTDHCPICGGTLLRGRWFIGGPGSALHPAGVYFDPPMHDECAHYALTVCPWLAAPNYERRIDDKTLKPDDPNRLTLWDPTVIPTRPAVFVALMSVSQTILSNGPAPVVRPSRPYRKIEYWLAGKRLPDAEGEAIAQRGLAEVTKIAEAQHAERSNG